MNIQDIDKKIANLTAKWFANEKAIVILENDIAEIRVRMQELEDRKKRMQLAIQGE